MAETNTAVTPEVSDTPDIAAQTENIISPAPDIGGGEAPPAQPQADRPELPDGEVAAPSNVIDGIFENKEAAAEEIKEQPAEADKTEQDAPTPKKRGGRPPKDNAEKAPDADKPKKAERAPRMPKAPKADKQAAVGGGGGGISGSNAEVEAAPPVEQEAAPPRDATRPGDTETVVYIPHAELHAFKGHPFLVRDDDAMKSLVESVKDRGVDQPAIVCPREDGGYELVAGHRRQQAAVLAGYANIPCIVRNMTDDEAILAMTESNFNQRAEILPSERA